MSFKATLFLNGSTYNVLSSQSRFFQPINYNGKPSATVKGGKFTLTVELDGSTDLLHPMVATEQMVEGYVRFYKRDGMATLVDYEFKDTHIYYYEVEHEAVGNRPTVITVAFSPGILKIGDVLFLKPWRISEIGPNKVALAPVQQKPDVPDLTSTHFEDANGNPVSGEIDEGEIYLIFESRDLVGKTVDIDLSQVDFDFKYKGEVIEDGILRDIRVSSNRQKLPLNVF